MTCRIAHTTVDCADAYALSTWWKDVLEYTEDPDDPNHPGDEDCLILPKGAGHEILFLEVPEPKGTKNRLHFDLRPTERTRDDEVAWVLGLGATLFEDHRDIHGPGTGWVTLADPEGNAFCILRGEA